MNSIHKETLVKLVKEKWVATQYIAVTKRNESAGLHGNKYTDKNGEEKIEPAVKFSLMGCILLATEEAERPNIAAYPNDAACEIIRAVKSKLPSHAYIQYWEDEKGRKHEDVVSLVESI